jgi:DHA1 family tetracycline resistance protein-like MFS transporter
VREHRAKIGTVFLIVFIDLVGFGMIIPILPLYAERFSPSPIVFGVFMAAYSAMQFLAAPVLGRLSDRFGRRPVLLVSLLGSAAGYVLLALAGSMELLILSRVIDGISGGNIATAQAVIADITGPEQRARGMGIVGAAFGLGFILGPAIGGVLASVGPWVPGAGAAAASLVAFCLVWTVLPETRPQDARLTRRAHPLNPRQLALALGDKRLAACLFIVFVMVFAFSNFEATFAQLMARNFEFGMREVSFLFVYAGLLAAIVQGLLVGRLVAVAGEERLVLTGSVVALAAAVVLPGIDSFGALALVLAALALGQGVMQPSLSSLVSRLAGEGHVGGVLGIYQSLSSLGRVFGPFFAQLAWGGLGPRWPYLIAAGAYALAAVASLAGLFARPRAASTG